MKILYLIGSVLALSHLAIADVVWVGVPRQAPIVLGSGYSPIEASSFTPCLNGEWRVQGATRSSLSLDRPIPLTQIRERIYGQGQWAAIRLANLPSLPRDSYDHERFFDLRYLALFGGRSINYQVAGLNDYGNSLLTTSEKAERAEICGQRFVEELKIGGYLHVSVKVTFESQIDRNKIQESGVFGGMDLRGLRKTLDFLPAEFEGRVKFTVRLMQMGGDPAKLQKLLSDLESKELLSCVYPKIDACEEGLDHVYRYITNPAQLLSQFDRPFGPSDAPGIVGAKLVPLSSVVEGFTPYPVKIAPTLPIMDEIATRLVDENQKLQHLDMLGSTGDQRLIRSRLDVAKSVINSRMDLLRDSLVFCRDSVRECRAEWEKTREKLTTLHVPRAIHKTSVLEVCLAQFPSLSDRRLVEKIKRQFAEENCFDLNRHLESVSSLDLTGSGIDDISALWPLNSLSVLKLKKNSLRKVLPGEPWPELWPRLTNLDLAGNSLEAIDLRPLSNLEVLDITDNKIADLKPDHLPSHLSYLAAWGNNLDEKQTRKRLKNRVKLLLLTASDVCRHHGQRLVDAGLVEAAELKARISQGEGPLYEVRSDGLRFIGWRTCTSIYKDYPPYINIFKNNNKALDRRAS